MEELATLVTPEQRALVFKLVLGAFLGSIIGFEREFNEKAAGFRTHALVCLGSTLIMEISMHLQQTVSDDPGRIAGQVISGIGFLGAGTIIRGGTEIRGLTTAASVWTVAGIGLAVGCGMYFAACSATFVVLVVLYLLGRVSRNLVAHRQQLKKIL